MARAKTKKVTKVSEAQKKHDAFTRDFVFNILANKRYVVKRHSKKVALKQKGGVKIYENTELKYSANGINLHPEFLAFYIGLKEGCAKKLLFYLLFHVVDLKTCQFPFNEHIIQEFNDYCKRINSVEYKVDVVKQAIRDIVNANLAISIKRKEYMINPLIVSTNKRDHWSLINTYTNELLAKEIDIDSNFFPKYAN